MTVMKSDIFIDEVERLSDEVYNAVIEDKEDMRKYVRNMTALIYDYKMLGMIYDFYAQDAEVYKQNCEKLVGPDAFFKNVSPFVAAFPDLKADIENIIVKKEEEGFYKVFRRLKYRGTNTGISKYGKATGKSLGDKCLNLTMMYVKKIEDKWKVVFAADMDSEDWIREVQTAD